MIGGTVAGAAYALLACSQGVVGTAAHSTHFVGFFAVIGTLLLLRSGANPGLLFLSGLAYGLAFLAKQPGIAFAAFGILYAAWRCRQARMPFLQAFQGLAALCLGVALPYALLCLALWRAGTFDRFWFWTVTLAMAYAAKVSLRQELTYFVFNFPRVVDANFFLWLMSGIGLLLACWNPATRRAGMFIGTLLAFSFLAVSAGGSFNPNYFIIMFPAVALTCGASVAVADSVAGRAVETTPGGRLERLAGRIALSGFALACLFSIAWQYTYLFQMSPYEFERSSYGLNPFPEAVKVADYIRSNSEPGARIAVLGSEAEIYFYSQRRAATGYLFAYGLMETHPYALQGQLEMISEIESARPEYLVDVCVPTSWMRQASSPTAIFYWMANYTRQYYQVVGVVDLVDGEPATYVWGSAATTYKPVWPAYMIVYRRL